MVCFTYQKRLIMDIRLFMCFIPNYWRCRYDCSLGRMLALVLNRICRHKSAVKVQRFHRSDAQQAKRFGIYYMCMRQIQEWLGHSLLSTTSDIYCHLDYTSKIGSSMALEHGLPLPNHDFKTNWEGSNLEPCVPKCVPKISEKIG